MNWKEVSQESMRSSLSRLYGDICHGRVTNRKDIVAALHAAHRQVAGASDRKAIDSYSRFARLIDIACARNGKPLNEIADFPQYLPSISEDGRPGTSVVTCSMNRNRNLVKALPSWLKHQEVCEIVIVDWSSEEPVRRALSDARVEDERIRILRVDGADRWVLSYAFNAGFRFSRYQKILKADADIVLSEDFFEKNELASLDAFVAGNWRKVGRGQEHTNGFFYASRRALAHIGGFNEYITTYGWDDDDLYGRLVQAGYERRDVAPDTIHHLLHSDSERTGAKHDDAATFRDVFESRTDFMIHRNRHLARLLPEWTRDQCQAILSVKNRSPDGATVEFSGEPAFEIPRETMLRASRSARRELLLKSHGGRVKDIPEQVIDRLMARENRLVAPLDFELAGLAPDELAPEDWPYLVIEPDPGLLRGPGRRARGDLDAAIRRLRTAATAARLHCIVKLPGEIGASCLPDSLRDLAALPSTAQLGELCTISVETLQEPDELPRGNLLLQLKREALEVAPRSAPELVAGRRRRLFIDAQHGLGNRLRAIGSAAAIAQATERELVIVWEPDHHCQARFHDLFEYAGAVIERCFPEDARKGAMAVYNYMTVEEGAAKDALVDGAKDGDIYARSAFVLKSPHSGWERENAFIRSLRPVEAVRALVESVRHPNDISAHVRMEAGPGRDQNSYDRPENWLASDHELIHKWRESSHFSRFTKRIDALIEEGTADTVFVAADLPETYDEFLKRYGDRIAWLPRELYDRSSDQLQYALADALLLGRARLMLGSTWSSFSELATRLAPGVLNREMSGKDF
ncbi:hypothetical protein DRV85_12320 [Rhodosalinus halophilus]|uniref:Uncharacterized protein n=2 Tax=Rhodosalinus halophilus TaxID=2259333 RepID=A0A365U7X6_9RHOB|nr:hypothetical protein DRV85_12320 [Rhodosalinus halophilus]